MKAEYSSTEIRSYTGGADPRGRYAELEIVELGFSDDKDPASFTGEEDIYRFVRRDIFESEVSRLTAELSRANAALATFQTGEPSEEQVRAAYEVMRKWRWIGEPIDDSWKNRSAHNERCASKIARAVLSCQPSGDVVVVKREEWLDFLVYKAGKWAESEEGKAAMKDSRDKAAEAIEYLKKCREIPPEHFDMIYRKVCNALKGGE